MNNIEVYRNRIHKKIQYTGNEFSCVERTYYFILFFSIFGKLPVSDQQCIIKRIIVFVSPPPTPNHLLLLGRDNVHGEHAY